jgi:hypothetical protein
MTAVKAGAYPDRVTAPYALSGTPIRGIGVSAKRFHLVMSIQAGCLIV